MYAGTGIPPGESLKHTHTRCTHIAIQVYAISMAQAIILAIYKSQ